MYDYVYSQKNTIIWQLQPDTLTIKSYKCLKATTTFEGRNYIAWYSTDIPISDGPHKFWGLPGLIIKIADTENHYIFELSSFEKFTGKFPEFRKPDQVFEVSYEKFKQLRKDEIENPRKALEAQGIKPVANHPILYPIQLRFEQILHCPRAKGLFLQIEQKPIRLRNRLDVWVK